MPERPRNSIHYGRFGELIRLKLAKIGCTCESGIDVKPSEIGLDYEVGCLHCHRRVRLTYPEALQLLEEARYRRVFAVLHPKKGGTQPGGDLAK